MYFSGNRQHFQRGRGDGNDFDRRRGGHNDGSSGGRGQLHARTETEDQIRSIREREEHHQGAQSRETTSSAFSATRPSSSVWVAAQRPNVQPVEPNSSLVQPPSCSDSGPVANEENPATRIDDEQQLSAASKRKKNKKKKAASLKGIEALSLSSHLAQDENKTSSTPSGDAHSAESQPTSTSFSGGGSLPTLASVSTAIQSFPTSASSTTVDDFAPVDSGPQLSSSAKKRKKKKAAASKQVKPSAVEASGSGQDENEKAIPLSVTKAKPSTSAKYSVKPVEESPWYYAKKLDYTQCEYSSICY